MSYLAHLLASTAKTRKILTTVTLGAAGWQAGKVVPDQLIGPQVRLYVWDRPTGWAWTCSVAREDFLRIASESSGKKANWDAIRGCVAYVVARAAGGSPPAPVSSTDWETQLAVLLSAYAGSTQTWAAAGKLAEGGHFVVLNYRPATVADGKLRPFVLGGAAEEIVSAEEFMDRVREVEGIDLQRHPEWFR